VSLVPPIFIDNAVDGLSHYPTVDALADRLELWYVTDEQFVAYDSTGRVVDLVVEERSPGSFLVTARCREEAVLHADQLRAVLIAYLARSGAAHTTTDQMTLDEAVGEVVRLPGD